MSDRMRGKSVLVVDDEDAVRGAVGWALTKYGYDVVEAATGQDALAKATQQRFDAAILDIRMPEMTGFDVMHALRRMSPETVLLILTAMPDPDSRFGELTKTAGVYAYLRKPCKAEELRTALEDALAGSEPVGGLAMAQEQGSGTDYSTGLSGHHLSEGSSASRRSLKH